MAEKTENTKTENTKKVAKTSSKKDVKKSSNKEVRKDTKKNVKKDTKKTEKKENSKKKKSVYSGIGGQAVLEGIMMKAEKEYSVAVRLPDGTIDVRKWDNDNFSAKHKWARLPFVRGVVNFIESLVLGMRTLTYSASFYEEEEANTKSDEALEKLFGDKVEGVVTGFTIMVSILLAVGLFMLLPYFASEFLSKYILNDSLIAIIEGALRILIFLIYVISISFMKDIRRLYQYHGAEHKCINCIESGKDLTVENVKKSSRLHRRCGTSFIFIVMIITVICFFFIRVDTIAMKIVVRLCLIPFIAGLSYEILRFNGRHDNFLVKILSAPGLLVQKITTKEPDEKIIEVAIASVEAIYDWKDFQTKNLGKVFETEDDLGTVNIDS